MRLIINETIKDLVEEKRSLLQKLYKTRYDYYTTSASAYCEPPLFDWRKSSVILRCYCDVISDSFYAIYPHEFMDLMETIKKDYMMVYTEEEKLLLTDVNKIDLTWEQGRIGKYGLGIIGSDFNKLFMALMDMINNSVTPPLQNLCDGRHRFAILRDLGEPSIPVIRDEEI